MSINENNICYAPWNLIRVEPDGNCYSCSSAFVKDFYNYGNLFEQDLDEIWNGIEAQSFRNDKRTMSYSFCRKNDCFLFCANFASYQNKSIEKLVSSKYPSLVSLSYDYTCSQRCVFCRDKVMIMPSPIAKKWESILESKIIPMLKDTKLLEISCSGEFFDSKHSQKILKKIVEVYPDIKLRIFSNGINFTQENVEKLGLVKNIAEVCLSIHSGSKRVHRKIFRSETYDRVLENMEYISKLKRDRVFDILNFEFAINVLNYKDIKKFIKLSEKYDAMPIFIMVNDTTNTEFVKKVDKFAVFKTSHYLYNDFVKRLSDPFVYKKLPEFLKILKPVSKIQIIKNYIQHMKSCFGR